MLNIGHGGLLLHDLRDLSHLMNQKIPNTSNLCALFFHRLCLCTYLDLLGSSGFLCLGDGCGEELRLDSWLKLSGSGVGHLLL